MAQQNTTNFILAMASSCVAPAGCNLFATPSLWDVPGVLDNPSTYNFVVNLTYAPGTLDLNVGDIAVNIQSLKIYGGQQTKLLFNSSDLIIANQLYVSNMQVEMVQDSTLNANSVLLMSSSLHLGQNSSLDTMSDTPANPDSVTVDTKSSINLYDSSTLSTGQLVATGAFNAFGESVVHTGIAQLYGATTESGTLFFASSSLKIYLDSTVMSGSVSTQLLIVNSGVTFTVSALTALSASIAPTSQIIVSHGNAIISRLEMNDISSTINVQDSTVTLGSSITDLQVLDGSITSSGQSSITLYNISFGSLTTTNRPDNLQLTVKGQVAFNSNTYINGTIIVAQEAQLTLNYHTEVWNCIEANGTVNLHDTLICYQDSYRQLDGNLSTLNMLDKAVLHVVNVTNSGWILVNSPTATILGNLVSYGEILVGVDCAINVVGFLDLFNSSYTQIGGIASNTSNSAIMVRDVITLGGRLDYNVSTPTKYNVQVYNLMSGLMFSGEFFDVERDASLDQYNTELVQQETLLAVIFRGEAEPKKENEHTLRVILGIFLPLLFVTVIGTVIFYLYRRDKQYKFYTRIQ
eukprot:gene5275-6113_t